ncbi:unnamed protein product [Vicia faba]|uniref:Uncharacterized protein n=1 Tax=Vicia faba TaxID=3906 RepID=A0AAV1AK86_VICFA|nr:unnamed protein product [Vicia faba]
MEYSFAVANMVFMKVSQLELLNRENTILNCHVLSTQIGGMHCPLREFHCFPDVKNWSQSISCMVSHLKMLHLSSDEWKNTIREAMESDLNLFTAFENTLKRVGQWICGKCMRIHAMNRPCHHPHGLVRVTHGIEKVESHIMDIVKPSTIDFDNIDANEGIVLDARLLERVFTTHIFIVKSIHLKCCLAFSQALKDVPLKVVY